MKFLPLHGGDIVAASKAFAIAIDQWIDLSTGINPRAYRTCAANEQSFQRLPYLKEDFSQAIENYYGHQGLAITGSQAVIQLLPNLLKSFPILAPKVGYQEHVLHWQAKTRVEFYPSFNTGDAKKAINRALQLDPQQHLLLINPNNPTQLTFSIEQIEQWSLLLAPNAYVIVDEAFIDLCPEQSMLSKPLLKNIIVLRSFGKFFGLAGLRLGFVFAHSQLLDKMDQCLGLWQINGPAQSIAIEALNNSSWHQENRAYLKNAAQLTQQLFSPLFESAEAWHGDLFSSYMVSKDTAQSWLTAFAKSGILLRVIDVDDHLVVIRVGVLEPNQTQAIKRIESVIEQLIT